VYRYRCGQCRTTSLPVRTRAELLAERDRHRRRNHGGHVPDGERLLRRRHPAPADTVRPAVVLILILAVLLLGLITRH
jgi:hypothetical protein